jgi:hypothetical protein
MSKPDRLTRSKKPQLLIGMLTWGFTFLGAALAQTDRNLTVLLNLGHHRLRPRKHLRGQPRQSPRLNPIGPIGPTAQSINTIEDRYIKSCSKVAACMDSKSELVQNWFIKAQHDLLATQKLSRDSGNYMDDRVASIIV